MKTPCEVLSKIYLPSIRAMIARELIETHKCTQMKIADWLGVTQAAISQYLSSKRADTERILNNKPIVITYIKEISEKLANGEKEKFDITKEICRICNLLKLKEEAIETPKRYAVA
ncbi:MAG: transcriptional regulator [Candidatus Jordarchaeum sp.]|uniref:transcriptional regulator n=1 Tax=Candidatus Jordarchaeum sp. TaxID=2823881 RepID=UPI00404B3F99